MSSTELKPCPACESKATATNTLSGKPWWVACYQCEVTGPDCKTAEDAITAWNAMPRRPVPRPYSEWTEADGPALWWLYLVLPLPYVGRPGDWNWAYSSGDEPNLYWTPIGYTAIQESIKALRGEA